MAPHETRQETLARIRYDSWMRIWFLEPFGCESVEEFREKFKMPTFASEDTKRKVLKKWAERE